MIAFRKLEASDLKFLVEVRNACRAMLHDDREYSLEQASAWFEAQKPLFFLLMLDGRPFGYFRTSKWDEDARSVYVGCDVHPDYEGKGLAQRAFRLVLSHLFNHCGIETALTEVLAFNQRARQLYDRLGFVPTKIECEGVWRDGQLRESIQVSLSKRDFESWLASQHSA